MKWFNRQPIKMIKHMSKNAFADKLFGVADHFVGMGPKGLIVIKSGKTSQYFFRKKRRYVFLVLKNSVISTWAFSRKWTYLKHHQKYLETLMIGMMILLNDYVTTSRPCHQMIYWRFLLVRYILLMWLNKRKKFLFRMINLLQICFIYLPL